jgi:hypothetical protein
MGGEGAAARLTRYLRPGTLTFYGEKAEPRFLLDHRLRTDPAGEVEILRRFWGFDNDDPALTPTLLVYADLLAIGDARCLEIEERLPSILTPEIDPGGPLRLIGEVVDMDMSAERALKLLAAFLTGFNREQRP